MNRLFSYQTRQLNAGGGKEEEVQNAYHKPIFVLDFNYE